MKSVEKAFERAFRGEPFRTGTKDPTKRREIRVCAEAELAEGDRRFVDAGTFTVGVFRIRGSLYAVRNFCPHNGAELCKGTLDSVYRPDDSFAVADELDGYVLTCPWHGRQFDVRTGYGLFDDTSKVPTYEVSVDDSGMIIVRV